MPTSLSTRFACASPRSSAIPASSNTVRPHLSPLSPSNDGRGAHLVADPPLLVQAVISILPRMLTSSSGSSSRVPALPRILSSFGEKAELPALHIEWLNLLSLPQAQRWTWLLLLHWTPFRTRPLLHCQRGTEHHLQQVLLDRIGERDLHRLACESETDAPASAMYS